jgi:SRSO17 transposase
MLSGLLMELEDHNCWTIAEAAGHRGRHRLQHPLSRAVWDDRQVLDIASAWTAGHLDDGDAVLIVDETADEKSSAGAPGAARQYSSTADGIALCQVAVTLTYATGTVPPSPPTLERLRGDNTMITTNYWSVTV